MDKDADAWAKALPEEKAPRIATVESAGLSGKAPSTHGVLRPPYKCLIRKDDTTFDVNRRGSDVGRAVAAQLAGGAPSASLAGN